MKHTKWINLKEKMPEFDKPVLTWCEWGFRWQHIIATLHNHDGPDGYMEYVNGVGMTFNLPNKPYPENLEWNIEGHWRKFKNVTHWMELPSEPISAINKATE